MYLFAVIGFFAAFLAFMKFGSNDFGISSGKEQPKGPKTFWILNISEFLIYRNNK